MKGKTAEVPEKPAETTPVAEVEAAEMPTASSSEQSQDVNKTLEQVKKKRFAISRLGLIVTGVVVLNLAIAGASAYLRVHKPKTVANQPVATAPAQNVQAETKVPEPETPKTLHYKSEKLGAEFDYPVDWRVQDYGEGVQLGSPWFSIKSADGAMQQGRLSLLISKNSQGAYVYEGDVAVTTPEQLAYKNPAPGQVSKTYVSFFGSGVNQKPEGSFNTVIIGGSFNYRVGQRLDEKNYKAASPFVEMHIEDIRSRHAMVFIPLTVDLWHNDSTLQQAKAIITSMRFN